MISFRKSDRVRFRAVLLDIDGTIYHQAPMRILMAAELAAMPVRCGSWKTSRDTWRILGDFRRNRERMRDAGPAEGLLERLQYEEVAARLGFDTGVVREVVEDWIYRRPLKYVRWCARGGLVEFMKYLAEYSVKTGFFSDYPVWGKLDALGIGGFASLGLCATDPEVNAFKPDVAGFLHAARRWDLDPSTVLYVGDREDTDAAGAIAAGMQCAILRTQPFERKPFRMKSGACCYPSFEALRKDLPPC